MEYLSTHTNISGDVDEQIINFLLKHKEAEWGELRKARPGKDLAHPVLKKAIDRLKKTGQIVAKPGFKKDKGVTLYALSTPIPALGNKRITSFVENFLNAIESAREQYSEDPYMMKKEIHRVQKDGLAILMCILNREILDELARYSQKANDTEAAEYLDAVIHKYLSVIIKNIAQITSPQYGPATEPVNRLKEGTSHRNPLDL